MATHGGRREGAGRPKNIVERKRHSVSATQEEWSAIEKFVGLVRSDREKCDEVLKVLEAGAPFSYDIRR